MFTTHMINLTQYDHNNIDTFLQMKTNIPKCLTREPYFIFQIFLNLKNCEIFLNDFSKFRPFFIS
jgi:hypothetical protein